MKRNLLSFSLIAGFTSLAGCGVQGKWTLADVEPTAATRDVQYHNLTLQKDGSFYAEAKEASIDSTSGTYTYEDGVLCLKEQDGERHTYDAKLVSATDMRLESFWQGQKLKLKYKRQE